MATSMRNVVAVYQNLKQEWNKKPPNLERCGEYLSELKIALTGLTFLPSNDENATKQVDSRIEDDSFHNNLQTCF
jgi:26S proteasome regulatory subunit N12